ncbi:MAG: hypothetical protein WC437_02335 [Patescibacteria group bacterium]|jgi:hypothetical protein|nr:hypothetical protein [Patescibacteria group bacterium]
MSDERIFSLHQPNVVNIDEVPQGKITHLSSGDVHYQGHERWVEHYCGHFCPVNGAANRHDHEGYQCVCGEFLCIDDKPNGGN